MLQLVFEVHGTVAKLTKFVDSRTDLSTVSGAGEIYVACSTPSKDLTVLEVMSRSKHCKTYRIR